MKRIAIIPNETKDKGLKITRRAAELLSGRAEVLMAEGVEAPPTAVRLVPYEELFEAADCMVVLGGDGTMLQIAAPCARRNIPVLGINLGRIGFLTEVETDGLEDAFEKLLAGDFETESRMLMKAEIIRDGCVTAWDHALNDVVAAKNTGAKLIDIELYAGGELVNKYIADGLIIATPTGSTGYSISAGGPVADPHMELYIATPICAHMLSVRSAVLPPDSEIVMRLDENYLNNGAVVSADGDVLGSIAPGDEVRITRSDYRLSIIKIGCRSFYDTVLKKLS
ncbi:MAG: NAD(+)/NADH kinase [Clostridia bacterium]|nr:NAD(+)/NADH kinase [Clostridia bacterium]